MTPLAVPDAAVHALRHADPDAKAVGRERDEQLVRAIATPVVVAELRDQAGELEAAADTSVPDLREAWRAAATDLHLRADELEATT